MILQSMYKNAITLGVFALVSIGLIAVFHVLTKDKIKTEMELKLARTINTIVDNNEYDNDIFADCRLIEAPRLTNQFASDQQTPTRFYRMYKDQQPIATVFTMTAPDGYSGAIEMIMGVYTSGEIAGVRVLDHQETPGLGDKIDERKSDWIFQFEGLSFDKVSPDVWAVKKDGGAFDSFTGATITPRAVVKQIKSGLSYAVDNQQLLFSSTKKCSANQNSATVEG